MAMLERNDKGKQVRRYFIQVEKKYKDIIRKNADTANQAANDITICMKQLTALFDEMIPCVMNMQADISEIKNRQTYVSEKPKYPSAFFKRMNRKYEMLCDYLQCTRKELYSSIYIKLEDICGIDINELTENYAMSSRIPENECYPMDAIEHKPEIRHVLENLINSYLVKFGLLTENELENWKRKTIFD